MLPPPPTEHLLRADLPTTSHLRHHRAGHQCLLDDPGVARVHGELRRPGVTLLLLWEEYRATQLKGYGYSRFCDLYAAWRGRLSLTMR